MHVHRWSFLFAVVITIPSSKISALYRVISNFIILIIMTCFVSIEFSCWRCPSYEERNEIFMNDPVIFSIFIYTWIAAVFVCLYWIIPFRSAASTSRNAGHMIQTMDWDGLKEMHLYAGVNQVWIKWIRSNVVALYGNGIDARSVAYYIIALEYEIYKSGYENMNTLVRGESDINFILAAGLIEYGVAEDVKPIALL